LSVAAVEVYRAAFLARCEAMQSPGRPAIDELGLCGLLAGEKDPRIRLLVTSDRAYEGLAALLPDARAGMIRIFGRAGRCAELVERCLRWSSETVTAMVCRDLRTVPALSLPSELSLRPVQRDAGDSPHGVALESAVAAVISAAPGIEHPPEALAAFLRSLPSGFRLFAAVDGDGTVRATSGCGVFGQHATIVFVNTDVHWRRRGVGQAMTAQALRAARGLGARQACLDASAAGRSIYSRLGFETAGSLTRFLSEG
jgi:ribosomal protein S18 acetylase RimI-like enzyme